MANETTFEQKVIKEIERDYPGAVVIKGCSAFQQGFPDRLVLWENLWAALEFKRSSTAPYRPNQPYWVNTLNHMSFARFIYPENKVKVLNELQYAFRNFR